MDNKSSQRIVTGRLFRVRAGHGWKLTKEAPAPAPEPVRRPARVAHMLALAHALQSAIDDGIYENRAEVAKRFGLTRARITQLLALVTLAPDIQEDILFMEAVDGNEPLSARALRPLVAMPTWEAQREVWRRYEQREIAAGQGDISWLRER